MAKRALSPNALPVVYSIKVTQSKTNHEIATWLRDDLQRGKIRLLVSELDAKDFYNTKKKFSKENVEEQTRILYPYFQTSILINEMVSLEWKLMNGFVKVFEVGTNRKDRYSSFAYCNYLARLLEQKLNKKEKESNILDYCMY